MNIHVAGLQAMGADINIDGGYIRARAGRLKGARLELETVTVTGTENLMMAATLADGETDHRERGARARSGGSRQFPDRHGRKIQGAGTDKIVIQGVEKLRGTSYEVLPDRIEGGTYLVAGAITSGIVRIKNAAPEHLDAVTAKLREAGAKVGIGDNWIEVDMKGKRPKSVDMRTAPYPAFPTDMQAQFAALNTVADGVGTIVETIFENRFMHMLEMRRLGAEIRLEGNTAIIQRRAEAHRARRSWRPICAPRPASCWRGSWPKGEDRRSSASITSIAATKRSKKSSRSSARRSAAYPTEKPPDGVLGTF